MNYKNPSLQDELAARYVLGTLRGRARRRMERVCRTHSAALGAVRRWENRLAGMADQVVPVQPPADVWQSVQKQLQPRRPTHRSVSFRWQRRTWLAVAAGLAAVVLAIGWLSITSQPATQLVATVVDEQQTELWRIDAEGTRTELRIRAHGHLSLDSGRAYELWALSNSGGAPVSLGLMPLSGIRVLALNTAQQAALAAARQVAISQEPPGGSPTGAPTGPVLFVAEVGSAG